MVDRVNKLTGQGMYNIEDLLPYFDETIDDINDALATNLPLISSVYHNDFSYDESIGEDPENYEEDELENEYRRIHDAYLRNYVCYEVSYRILRDEDEDAEVYEQRAMHARRWLRKLVSNLGDYRLSISDTILIGDDVPGRAPHDIPEPHQRYIGPYFPEDD